MKPLDYLSKRTEIVTEKLSKYSTRVELYWWERTIVNDLRDELETLKQIKDELLSKV